MKTRMDAATPLVVRHLLLFSFTTLYTFGLGVTCAAAATDQPEAVRPLLNAVTGKPVILLTGFEPFGKYRLPNPSWEGIKELDGQSWKGYQLVCKQLPVTWGAPLEHLPGWIAHYQPAAIFSFGQGASGSFALESLAFNEHRHKTAGPVLGTSTVGFLSGSPLRTGPLLAASASYTGRGLIADNRGAYPTSLTITEDGPRSYRASSNTSAYKRLLAEKGYPTRVSRTAGRYLCEETLYSLEYLKSTKQFTANVLFCHVPSLDTEIGRALVVLGASTVGLTGPESAASPLLAASALLCGKTLRGKPVDAEYVQRFVLDTIETWHTLYRNEIPTSLVAQTKAEDSRREEIKEFIGRYFRTWSTQDMKGYDGCFLPDATIQYIDEQGQLASYARRQFIANQTEFHKRALVKATEVPESMDIRFEAKLARAIVYWRLTAGTRIETGYDHFTLIKNDGNWRIVNLTFYPSAKKIPD